jgi:DNA-binding helix-hairpin-helix protein with protein kinase domain
MADLKKGVSIVTKAFKTAIVLEKLGEGGQGTVYKVDYNGEPKALKWYFAKRIADQKKFRENLENNIKKGAPAKVFLWPEDMTESDQDSFGYIMPLRPAEYKDFSRFLTGRERFASVTAMTNASLNIVAGFRELHNKGYSYQDLNDGNFFIDPRNGGVLICDNDNVSEFGKKSGIAGKARYMAPEIVLGADPDVKSDRFSLSVILFLLWTNNHPLEGKAACPPCMDAKNERRIYGENPIFIFDPADESNRPVPGLHKGALARYPLLPAYLKEKFEKEFSKQIMHDPSHRTIERDWLHTFIRMRGEVYKCACGEVYFCDPVNLNPCPKCGNVARLWGYMKTPRYNLPIHQRTRLYDCHTHKDSDEYDRQIGAIIQANAGWALKNQSDEVWRIDGRMLEPNGVMALVKGMTIDFGASGAEII